jgi:phosphocarrier protein HPr
MPDKPLQRILKIANQRGLHARAAAKFAQVASEFEAEIKVSRAGQTVSARSIMGLMMLGAAVGYNVELKILGSDAEHAMQAIIELVEGKFGED